MPEPTPQTETVARLIDTGYAFLAPTEAAKLFHADLAQLNGLRDSWARLPRDTYLRDGGKYRSRRHSCFVQSFSVDVATPARCFDRRAAPALTGSRLRTMRFTVAWSAGSSPSSRRSWTRRCGESWLRQSGCCSNRCVRSNSGSSRPINFASTTADGIGRPTPEGAHRDGVDFVAVILAGRRNIRGGETRVFDATGPSGVRFTMQEPWSMLLMDDARVIHETTPIQPDTEQGVRDTPGSDLSSQGFPVAGRLGRAAAVDPGLHDIELVIRNARLAR